MMATELIERLEEVVEKNGDLMVSIDTSSAGDSVKVETRAAVLGDDRVVIGLDGHFGRGG